MIKNSEENYPIKIEVKSDKEEEVDELNDDFVRKVILATIGLDSKKKIREYCESLNIG